MLMEGEKQRNPCGLIMGGIFNDSFAVSGYTLDVSKVAWPAASTKFKNGVDYVKEVEKGPNSTEFLMYQMYPGVIDKNKGVEDPRAAVWADTAATSNFRKLYGILTTQTLQAGSTLN